ncbi:hypothetical protein GGS23DRAFT_599921 [Durotheca rogersii]|uniref:uncharacterized protein n=1 Tax=Durotheca rogersii TaxID=419775 RepID=UPI00222010EC|nr:uncharacterized protein GGS23DRAFT_599921 [Durotheca rogersii]KAI5859993.1 hypothetical protein GGS23DRAFT_599921 [Durotheca rogersii]
MSAAAASFSPSLAMTNPALVWPHQEEQKQRTAAASASANGNANAPSSASIRSESTAYSHDKAQPARDPAKRSIGQRIKSALGSAAKGN